MSVAGSPDVISSEPVLLSPTASALTGIFEKAAPDVCWSNSLAGPGEEKEVLNQCVTLGDLSEFP
jgi:hypothetical protein